MNDPDLPYAAIFESNPLPMWVLDGTSKRFLAVNEAAARRSGHRREDFAGMRLPDLRPPHDLHGLPARDLPWGSRVAHLVVAPGAIEAEAEQRFRLIARATTDAIWDWNCVTGEFWWNDGSQELFGAVSASPTHTFADWEQRVHPEDRARVVAGLLATQRGGGDEWSDEYRYRRADGSWAHVADRGFVLRAADGTPVRIVGGMSDQTLVRAVEARTRRAQRAEGIAALAGGIAHDLNNLLTPVLASIDLLRAHVPPEAEETLDTIERSATRAADLVAQVLQFARGVDGTREPLDVRRLLADAAREAKALPEGVRLEVNVPPGTWAVLGDPAQLCQVLLHLIANAAEAMPGGGKIQLLAENDSVDDWRAAEVPDARAGSFVRLTVRDEGIGMGPVTCERAFEPFFTTKAVGKGRGLGLSMVQAIVRSHGGFVVVRSALGEGASFELSIPASRQPYSEAEAKRRLTPSAGLGHLVLLADDEPHIRQLVRMLLERRGFRVIAVADGLQALAEFERHAAEVALVVTDLQMPGLDGPAVIEGVRRLAPGVPVIAMSGYAPEDVPASAAPPTDVVHLLKPFSGAQFESVVRRALSQR